MLPAIAGYSHGPLSCHADIEAALLQLTAWNVRPSLHATISTTVIVSPLPPGLLRLSAENLPTPVARFSRRLEGRKVRQNAIALGCWLFQPPRTDVALTGGFDLTACACRLLG